MTDCVFCVKVNDYIDIVATRISHVWSFEPLNPVTPGHLLFIHSEHTKDAAEDPLVTAQVMAAAAHYARYQESDFNLITSAGKDATQTIEHFHVHYVPRRFNDGLHLPWTGQKK